MSDPNFLQRLRDMRDAAKQALDIAKAEDFDESPSRELAVRYLVIVMGEAAAYIPEPVRVSHPDIPWGQIKGMRNRLAHEYWRVDSAIVRDAARNDMASLIVANDRVIAAESESPSG